MKNKFEKALKNVYDENWWIKGFIPFGYDEGGETFCFSTRACDYGCIYYFMSDCIDDENLENDVKMFIPDGVVERASWTHFYVIEDNKVIVGCGAIGSYWGKEDESSLFNIFVLLEYQGKGVGRKIIETLEKDEFFLRAKRVEIPASIKACEFYKKMGYTYKNGIDVVDEEQLFRLEKFMTSLMTWQKY